MRALICHGQSRVRTDPDPEADVSNSSSIFNGNSRDPNQVGSFVTMTSQWLHLDNPRWVENKNLLRGGGGLRSTEVAFLLLTQRPWDQFSAFLNICIDVAEIYWWRWLDESGQRLRNVDWSHLVQASGNWQVVLQKKEMPDWINEPSQIRMLLLPTVMTVKQLAMCRMKKFPLISIKI